MSMRRNGEAKSKGTKSSLGALLLGAIGQALAWLPASIALLPAVPLNDTAGWLALTAGASLFGGALTAGAKLRPWIVYATLIACIAGGAFALGVDWHPNHPLARLLHGRRCGQRHRLDRRGLGFRTRRLQAALHLIGPCLVRARGFFHA